MILKILSNKFLNSEFFKKSLHAINKLNNYLILKKLTYRAIKFFIFYKMTN